MNIYDKINELAKELKNTEEVINYKKISSKVNENPTTKSMVDDIRKKQMEVYTLKLQGKEPSADQLEAFNKLYAVAGLNPDVRDYFEAEMRFSKLWEDILKTLGEAVDIKFPG